MMLCARRCGELTKSRESFLDSEAKDVLELQSRAWREPRWAWMAVVLALGLGLPSYFVYHFLEVISFSAIPAAAVATYMGLSRIRAQLLEPDRSEIITVFVISGLKTAFIVSCLTGPFFFVALIVGLCIAFPWSFWVGMLVADVAMELKIVEKQDNALTP
jgi:hypothetical protein